MMRKVNQRTVRFIFCETNLLCLAPRSPHEPRCAMMRWKAENAHAWSYKVVLRGQDI